MKKSIRFDLLIVECLLLLACKGGRLGVKDDLQMSGWNRTVIESLSVRDVELIKQQTFSWEVYQEDTKVKVRKKVHQKMKRTVIKFASGFIIGTDFGEFGGKLFWSLDSNTIHPNEAEKVLLYENIKGCIHIGNTLIVLSGIQNMSIRKGNVWKVDTSLQITKLSDLNESPECYALGEDDILYFATHQSVYQYSHGVRKIKKLPNKMSLLPNSMIFIRNYLYIGTRLGVVVLKSTEPYDMAIYRKD